MKTKFRCDCPVTSALDVLGDKWILVIVKLMLLDHYQTFKEFVESDEAIATNILSSKLKILEEVELVRKFKRPDNKKVNLYHLTEKGLALIPVITELIVWSDNHLRALHPTIAEGEGIKLLRNDKTAFIDALEKGYRKHVLTS
jgi:DNA-binding HxlR family transcriptional regulator